MVLPALLYAPSAHGEIGIFQDQQDVGNVLHAGSARYDAARQSYTITGSGANMWFGEDDFHYVWKKVTGDVALAANIGFVGTTGNNHRKAVLMIRQSLDAGSTSVDLARHGDGLTSLQYRDAPSADTHEVESALEAPARVRIEKRGDFVYAYVSNASGKLVPSGAATKIKLSGEYYIGLGVCSHDKDASETAIFSKVKLDTLGPATGKPVLYSTLETVTVASTDRRVSYVAAKHFEAPNWTRDGAALLFNQDGGLQRFAIGRTEPTPVATGTNIRCNNDHGLSPDGSMLAISDQTESGGSRVYVLPSTGGTPRQVTKDAPSYWHGWSPDGRTIAFTGQRNGDFDIYTIPVTGGIETRLTTTKGIDDGAEYSPDGSYIYFNSERSGSMQIWRMHPDGTGQEQVITDDSNDWFPHISPDGTWMVFLAYQKGVIGHPANQDVELRLMSMADRKVHLLAKLFGGQGTINVPSWSPDSRKLAFVSYEMLPAQDPSAQ